MPAYENDVLSALSQTGGLPGLDVFNEVVVFKGGMNSPELLEKMKNLPHGKGARDLADKSSNVVVIPLRSRPNEPIAISKEDIILNTGDVVFLEARDAELYYTGGLLPVGEFVLPRDYDLDVVKAIAQVKGPLVNGAFGTNNITGASGRTRSRQPVAEYVGRFAPNSRRRPTPHLGRFEPRTA